MSATQPTQEEINNAKDNLSHLGILFHDVRSNLDDKKQLSILKDILSDIANPGFSSKTGAGISDFLNALNVLPIPGIGKITGLLNEVIKGIPNNHNPDDPKLEIDDYLASISIRLEHAHNKLMEYEKDPAANWNVEYTDPVNNTKQTISAFGIENVVPVNAPPFETDYTKLTRAMKASIVNAIWRKMISIEHYIEGDGAIPEAGVDLKKEHPSSICYVNNSISLDEAKIKMMAIEKTYPHRFFKIDSKLLGDSSFSFYNLRFIRNGNFASKVLMSHLFIDNEEGTVVNENGIATRDDVFLKWGLKLKPHPFNVITDGDPSDWAGERIPSNNPCAAFLYV